MSAPTEVTIPTMEPCPAWCQEPAGHPFTEEELGEIGRWHRARFGVVEVVQLDMCEMDTEGVWTSTDGPHVYLRDDSGSEIDLSPADLARLLSDLQRALASTEGQA